MVQLSGRVQKGSHPQNGAGYISWSLTWVSGTLLNRFYERGWGLVWRTPSQWQRFPCSFPFKPTKKGTQAKTTSPHATGSSLSFGAQSWAAGTAEAARLCFHVMLHLPLEPCSIGYEYEESEPPQWLVDINPHLNNVHQGVPRQENTILMSFFP